MFRGREMAHPELGKQILDQVAEEVVRTWPGSRSCPSSTAAT